MADSNTTNHGLILPEIGASKDTWGTKLNSNFTSLDNLLRTSATSIFLPRSGGGDVTGPLIFTANGTYDARIGQADFPLTIRRKSDGAIAFSFDGAAGLDGSAPDARSVMNRAMTDTRYVRSGEPTTFTGNTRADLLVGHSTRVLGVRRKSDSLDTHNVFDADITNPDLASDPRSILTRTMGDNRYLKLTGGNTISGTQIYTSEARYTGVKDGLIAIGGTTTTPFYAQRANDNMLTHVILDTDITAPDDPSHARSILTRTMGDRRYPRKDAYSLFTAEQAFNARAVFIGNDAGQLNIGQSAISPFYIARKPDGQVTHIIPNEDITDPDIASGPRSVLTRTMGDNRYPVRTGGNTIAGTQIYTGEARYTGVSGGVISVGSSGTTPFYAQRSSDNEVTHLIPVGDITAPDDPSNARSILTRTMGDRRYVSRSSATEGPITITKAGSGRVDLASTGVSIQTGGPDQASLSYHFRARDAAMADRFRVLANGNVQNVNNSYGAISDRRLKENIADADQQLDDLLLLQVRTFNMKQGEKHKQIGLIAQEVQQIKPGLVEVDPEGMLSVKYSVLVPILLKALQELTAEVRRNSPVTAGA